MKIMEETVQRTCPLTLDLKLFISYIKEKHTAGK